MPDRDVVVVGGGPAGCAAAVFTARYDLDTVVFDKGSAALPRCAYLTNYLGFPAGIGVETFQDLIHAHVAEVGATVVSETVTAVERAGDGFAVTTQEGRQVTATHVVAASWYDGSYLEPLGDDAMFELQEHHGEEAERFDPDYPDADGRTPVEGLYVASPAGSRSEQAVVAAGNGAHVARSLLEDRRREDGYAGDVAPHYDWLRRASEFSGEWSDRDRWREWFDNEMPAEVDDERFAELRERYIDAAFETKVTEAEAEARAKDGIGRLVEVIGEERILEAIDDETIRAHATRKAEQD